jgi:hypothetical protein
LKHSFPILLLVLLILLSSCAAPNKQIKQDKLRKELKKWESFDSQGIVEISYMGLSLRKMFVASKNHQQMRIDIIDGGIMGAGAVPLISFYSGDYIALKSPYMPMLEMLNPTDLIPSQSLDLFGNADSLFFKYGETIISTKKLEIDSVLISFLPDYRLDKVYDPRTQSELQASYSSNKTLAALEMKAIDNMKVKLIFDQIKYTEPEITPLPKPRAGTWWGDGNPFENMNFKQLLKSFLDK